MKPSAHNQAHFLPLLLFWRCKGKHSFKHFMQSLPKSSVSTEVGCVVFIFEFFIVESFMTLSRRADGRAMCDVKAVHHA